MKDSENRAFRAELDGTITPIEWKIIKEEMKKENILVIYCSAEKSIYYWIGSEAQFTVKRNIANISNQLNEKAPDLRILRRNTVNQGKEPNNFMQLIES